MRYDKDEIYEMSVEELKDAKIILETQIADIKMQLDDAKIDEKEYGIKPDPEWLKKASWAKTAVSNRLLMINYRLSKLKMEKHKSFERVFVDTAKEHLEKEVFEYLVKLTQLKIEER